MLKKSSRKADRVIRRPLADGTIKEYHYGPYRKKRAKRVGDTLGDLIAAWQMSPEWDAFAEATKSGYVTYIKYLMNMQRVAANRVSRRELIEQRNAVFKSKGPGAATGFVRAASALFGWAVENGWLEHSPTNKIKRLEGGHLPTWTQDEAKLALTRLPEHLRRPVLLALYSAQRRGDLVRLPWSAYDGKSLRLRQGKTGTALVIPVHPVLKAELDQWRASAGSTLILVNKFGRPWQPSNLSKQIGDALAEIDGFPAHRNIHGLRKLAAVNLAQCGCTLHEIGSITGHKSLAMIQLYTADTDQERLAEAAVLRWTGKRD